MCDLSGRGLGCRPIGSIESIEFGRVAGIASFELQIIKQLPAQWLREKVGLPSFFIWFVVSRNISGLVPKWYSDLARCTPTITRWWCERSGASIFDHPYHFLCRWYYKSLQSITSRWNIKNTIAPPGEPLGTWGENNHERTLIKSTLLFYSIRARSASRLACYACYVCCMLVVYEDILVFNDGMLFSYVHNV